MTIKDNIETIQGALPKHVTLIAVSKTRTVEEMKEAYGAGLREFGENKVQELIDKVKVFPSDVKWHLIGHLQRNKVKFIVESVSLIHSLDSIRLLEEIEKQYGAKNISANVLFQINIGREESKTGALIEELEELIYASEKCNYVKVKGIMTIIPPGDEKSCKRYFSEVRSLWEKLKSREFKNITMEYLSMGMSGDYKIAVEEGSNMVRVGEGIFGKRNYNNY